jgi:alpha-D-ribose 1-methylphosphonate 5-triphosphate synthase subunit PhnI
MYVAVKGGERAIENAHRLLAQERRGDPAVPELSLEQIEQQLTLGVDRVMNEGSLYDRELAALAIKQARGDLIEAIFLLRAFRATLPRFGHSEPIDTGSMTVSRRISSTFKDIPGGQVLGPTFDYTHRLLETQADADMAVAPAQASANLPNMPRATDLLAADDLIERSPPAADEEAVGDLTQDPLRFPAERDLRLQNLARGDEGFLLALGYSTQRGYGRNHPFAGEIRLGEVEVEFAPEEIGFAVPLGRITVAPRPSRRALPAATVSASAIANARRWPWHWSIAPYARASSVKRRRARRKTKNSCCRIPTMCKRQGLSNISSCRTTSTSKPNLV